MTPREWAMNYLKGCYQNGRSLASVLESHQGGGSSEYSYGMNGMSVFGGGEIMPTKRGKIGVIIKHENGTRDRGLFSIRELWNEVVNPKPVQLSLFDEVQR